MQSEVLAADLDENPLCEHAFDLGQVLAQKAQEFIVGDVARADQEQALGLGSEEKAIDKITVLGDDDTAFLICKLSNLKVAGGVPGWEIECVDGIVSPGLERPSDPTGQLGIHDKFHAINASMRLVVTSRAPQAMAARRSSSSRSS